MTRRSIASIALSAALLGGCSLIPDYIRPGLPVSATYPTGPAYKTSDLTPEQAMRSAASIGWHEFFTDPKLQDLIAIALRNNRNLLIAVLNVAAAQAQFRVQRADLFPHISLSGAGEYGTLPASTSIPTSSGGGGGGATSSGAEGTTGAPRTIESTGAAHVSYRYYNVGLGFASYELDVFGRLRSLSAQAFEQYLASAETARSTQISLVAEVATAYFSVRADQELLKITQDTVGSEQEAYNLTNLQFKGGYTTLLSVKQAETALEQAKANLSLYTRQAAQDENALVLLLGQPLPADLPLGRDLEHQELVANLDAGLPSDLLLRRPDIVSAEHSLLAANANIGAARAAFFPSISLTGSGGVAGSQLSHLFTSGGLTWSFAPQINIPIFTAGQNQGALDVAKIQKNVQIATYEQTIQTAFREVSDALAGRATYVDQIHSQERLVDAAADSLRLSLMRFRAGVDSFLPVLQAQTTLYPAQQTLLSLRQAELVNLINLYKALGGGWQERAAVGTPPAPTTHPA